MEHSNFNTAYKSLLTKLVNEGVTEINSRTGAEITMLQGGHSFKFCLKDGRLPVAGNRRYYPRIAAIETAWQFMGTKDPTWIVERAPKLWSKFVEDGELKTAYGFRWTEHFGRNQLAMAIHELINNPTNRQLFISAWDPCHDGLGAPDQPKNIPCPVGFSLTTSENFLHMSVFIRSSDVFVGLPYDVMSYALTLDAIATTVGLVPGYIHFTLAHAHFYDIHKEDVMKSVADQNWKYTVDVSPNFVCWDIDQIIANPDAYVKQVTRMTDRKQKHDWDAQPGLVE